MRSSMQPILPAPSAFRKAWINGSYKSTDLGLMMWSLDF